MSFLIPLPHPIAPHDAATHVDDAGLDCFRKTRLIATDMDGTLTAGGKFTSQLLHALEALAEAKIPVLIVTGRSGGWVSGLAHYLPVVGTIAENGGVFYAADRSAPMFLTAIADLNSHRQKLKRFFQRLQTEYPRLQESEDNQFRLTDWTFDVQGLDVATLQKLATYCQIWGWGFTYSTVQCHIKPPQQDKATGLLQVLGDRFPHCTPAHVLTLGDSPNDESLFDSANFPCSVGVANVAAYTNQLAHQPRYMTAAPEVAGFCELVQLLQTLHPSFHSEERQ